MLLNDYTCVTIIKENEEKEKKMELEKEDVYKVNIIDLIYFLFIFHFYHYFKNAENFSEKLKKGKIKVKMLFLLNTSYFFSGKKKNIWIILLIIEK